MNETNLTLPDPGEGYRIVGAIRQPLPMQGAASILGAFSGTFGKDSVIVAPGGLWLFVAEKVKVNSEHYVMHSAYAANLKERGFQIPANTIISDHVPKEGVFRDRDGVLTKVEETFFAQSW